MFSLAETIRRMNEWTTGSDYLPLYHVDGELNLSDLLTKKHDLLLRICPQVPIGKQDIPG